MRLDEFHLSCRRKCDPKGNTICMHIKFESKHNPGDQYEFLFQEREGIVGADEFMNKYYKFRNELL